MALLTDEETGKREQPHWYWYRQNFYKEKHPHAHFSGWRHGRLWMHSPHRNVEANMEWNIPTRFAHAYIHFGGNDYVKLAFGCWLFAFWFSLEHASFLKRWKLFTDWHERAIDVSIFNWSINWKLWVAPHEWHSKTPKWRDGHFDIPNFLLGKNKYTNVEHGREPITLHFLEADYPATAIRSTSTWKRPRWPWPKVVDYIEIEVENGVPIPGKGENSWDIDDDGYTSISMATTSVEAAILNFYNSVNERRMRYGGRNWTPEKRKP